MGASAAIFGAFLAAFQALLLYRLMDANQADALTIVIVGAGFMFMLTASLIGVNGRRRAPTSRTPLPLEGRDRLGLYVVAGTMLFLLLAILAVNNDQGFAVVFALVPPLILLAVVLRARSRDDVQTLIHVWLQSATAYTYFFCFLALTLGVPADMLREAPRRLWLNQIALVDFPRIAGPYGSHGLTGGVGLLLVCGGLVLMRRQQLLVISAGLILIIVSESRAALFGVLIGLFLLVLPKKRLAVPTYSRGARVLSALSLTILLFLMVLMISSDPLLNGRLSSADPSPDVPPGTLRAFSHNSFLDISGAIGFALSVGYILVICFCFYVSLIQARAGNRKALVLLTPLLLYGLVEAGIALGSRSMLGIGWILVILFVVHVDKQSDFPRHDFGDYAATRIAESSMAKRISSVRGFKKQAKRRSVCKLYD